jgi:hypothetical protein
MELDMDEINQVALDRAKVFAQEKEFALSEHDITVLKWGIASGSLATLEAINGARSV